MWQDPIIEELQQTRDEYAKQFNYDLKAMFEDIKRQEQLNAIHTITSISKFTITSASKLEFTDDLRKYTE